jgi:hypothetical protein
MKARRKRSFGAARRSGANPLLALAAVLLLAAAANAASAQGLVRDFNWAYAAAYGTGKYRLGDGSTITVARLPFHWTWREPDSGHGCRCGAKLLLPVTVGVENFDLEELPEHTNELGFFPGIEVELPRTEHWTLKVSGQAGRGVRKDGARETARLYGAGLRSRYAWPDAPGGPALIAGLYWSAYRMPGEPSRTLARFSTGAEFDVRVGHWKFAHEPMHLMPHVLADWYFDPLDIEPILSGSANRVRLEWEVGLAAGRDDPFSVLGVKFDRVGLAVRSSEHSHGVRIYFASIF